MKKPYVSAANPYRKIELNWLRLLREQLPVFFRCRVYLGTGRIGFEVHRQRGSHIVLVRKSPAAQTTIPNHKELDRGTLRAIIRQTGLTVEEFLALL
jgi:predicted RNA binding protein YcfA (HicA-like mRNA interferase family)